MGFHKKARSAATELEMHDVYCTTDFFKRNVTFLFRWMQQINQSGVGSRPKELKGEEIEKKSTGIIDLCQTMEYDRPSSYKLLTLLLKIYLLSGNRSSNDITITTPGQKMRPNCLSAGLVR